MGEDNFNERPKKSEKKLLTDFLNSLIKNDQNEDNIAKYERLIKILNEKKYGIVWEEHIEEITKEIKTKIPVFKEIKDRKINMNSNIDNYNFILEGDNLYSLHLLNKTHHGKIDVIYIDPPYNTGKKAGSFRYNDKLVLKDDSYIHSKWLSFMNSRLKVANNLLNDNGVIFVHIDENEYAQIKLLLDEIFGADAFVENIIWNKRVPKNDKGIGAIHEYILVYTKNSKNKFMIEKESLDEIFNLVQEAKQKGKTPLEAQNELRKFYKKNDFPRAITLYNNLDNDYRIFGKINMSWPNANTYGPRYEILHPKTNKPVKIPTRGWRWKKETLDESIKGKIQELEDGSLLKGKIWYAKDEKTQTSSIKYLDETNRMLLRSIISLKSDGSLELEKLGFKKNEFPYAKPISLIKELISSITYNNPNATILDFFAGSGTTGQAVIELNNDDGGNRNFILATNNENEIAEKITYKRMKSIANGTKNYKEKELNLKYFKIDLIDKKKHPGFSLEYEILKYIIPLVELEFLTDISNPNIQVILNEEQFETLISNELLLNNMIIFIHPDVFLDEIQKRTIDELNIKLIEIPDYYFGMELW